MTVWLPVVGMLALAALLLRAGLRGRRIGTEPFCRKCEYQLTGIQSARCPECGSELNERAIVHGVRKRRWGLVAAAIALALFVPTSQIATIRWYLLDYYTILPFAVVRHMESRGSARASFEFMRRLGAWELSSREVLSVYEEAVSTLRLPVSATVRARWTRYVDVMFNARLLSQEQEDRFFPRFSEPILVVRPIIREGDPLPLMLQLPITRPGVDQYAWGVNFEALHVNGKVQDSVLLERVDNDWVSIVPHLSTPVGTHYIWRNHGLPAGSHTIQFTGSYHVSRSVGSRRKDLTATAEVTVLNRDAPDPVQWADDPILPNKLPSLFTVSSEGFHRQFDDVVLYFDCGGCTLRDCAAASFGLTLTLRQPVPSNLAFSLQLEADGRLIPGSINPLWSEGECSTFAWKAGTTGPWISNVEWWSVPRAEKVYLILESSRDVARETVDIFEVWRGSVRLGPFRTSIEPESEVRDERDE